MLWYPKLRGTMCWTGQAIERRKQTKAVSNSSYPAANHVHWVSRVDPAHWWELLSCKEAENGCEVCGWACSWSTSATADAAVYRKPCRRHLLWSDAGSNGHWYNGLAEYHWLDSRIVGRVYLRWGALQYRLWMSIPGLRVSKKCREPHRMRCRIKEWLESSISFEIIQKCSTHMTSSCIASLTSQVSVLKYVVFINCP